MPDFLVGIDLGTSNCAVAYIDAGHSEAIRLGFPIIQAIRPSDVRPHPLLPSVIYLRHPEELPPEAYALPWDPAPPHIVGEFARWQGARVPARMITRQNPGFPTPASTVRPRYFHGARQPMWRRCRPSTHRHNCFSIFATPGIMRIPKRHLKLSRS